MRLQNLVIRQRSRIALLRRVRRGTGRSRNTRATAFQTVSQATSLGYCQVTGGGI